MHSFLLKLWLLYLMNLVAIVANSLIISGLFLVCGISACWFFAVCTCALTEINLRYYLMRNCCSRKTWTP